MSQTAGGSPEGSSAPSYEQLAEAVAERDVVIVELQAAVAELQQRLGQDSSNSSRPPSAEGLGRKPAQPRRRGGRPGKQPGTPGAHLAQVADPDEIVDHAPEVCGGCGGGLDDAAVVGVTRRQVFDLPQVRAHVRAHVIEHRAQRRRCGCGHVTAADFPAEAAAPTCYGPAIRAAMVYLQVAQHLPVARAAQLLGDLLGVAVATGAVAGLVGEAAAKAAPAVEEIREQLVAAGVVHLDETGARVAGRLHWIHSASTDRLTLYHADPRRGRAAMDAAGVLSAFAGVAVHDCWSPYWSYATDHALCGAHLLRELTAAAESGDGQDWARHYSPATSAWSSCSRRSPAAGGPYPERRPSAPCAATSPPHASTAPTSSPSYATR